MKKSFSSFLTCAGLPLLLTLGYSAHAVPVLSTDARFLIDGGLVADDPASGPPPATISSLVTTDRGFSVEFARDAFAAAASTSGNGSVRADGVFAFPPGEHELQARATFGEVVTNTTGATQDYFFDFNVVGPLLEIDDYVFGPVATIQYDITIELDGAPIWSSAAALVGGQPGFTLTQTGTDLGATFFCLSAGCTEATPGNRFGYTFGDFSDRLSLGAFADGASFTLETILDVSVSSPPFEMGGLALIGDPSNIGTAPGVSGSVSVGVIPVPAAVWLFGSGLLGLVGLARRKAA